MTASNDTITVPGDVDAAFGVSYDPSARSLELVFRPEGMDTELVAELDADGISRLWITLTDIIGTWGDQS